MTRIRRVLLATGLVVGVATMSALPTPAEKPGPGSKICIPGHNGNPHPGAKPAGPCPP